MRTDTIEMTTYEPGDVVKLITGGPEMTVLEICDDCGDVGCGWFNPVDKHWHFEAIQVPAEALQPVVTN